MSFCSLLELAFVFFLFFFFGTIFGLCSVFFFFSFKYLFKLTQYTSIIKFYNIFTHIMMPIFYRSKYDNKI